MMTMRTMQMVVSTVNEHWESPLANQLIAGWKNDGLAAKYWRASANFIFFFKRDGRDAVLRFNHESERHQSRIQAEIELLDFLFAHEIPVARPLKSLNGQSIERIPTEWGTFNAVVFEAVPGKQFEFDELTTSQFESWGAALARLHTVLEDGPNLDRPTWEDHVNFIEKWLPAGDGEMRSVLTELERRLAKLPQTKKDFGLIHFDFELDNLLWQDGEPSIIDFDDSAAYWYAADIAFCLRDLFKDSVSEIDLQHDLFLRFIEGYRVVRPIDAGQLNDIPLFLRFHHLLNIARLARALTPINPAGELPWMAGLRQKMADNIARYRHQLLLT